MVIKPSKGVIFIYKVKGFKFGVEIECFCPDDDHWDFKNSLNSMGIDVGSDGSISPNDYCEDMELRTPPQTMPNTIKTLQKIEELAKKYHAKVNSSCGVHVHVSNPQFFDPVVMRKILGLWVAIEDVMFSTQPQSRFNNSYCKRRLQEYASRGFPTLPAEKQALVNELGCYDRYYALNVASMSRHGTLECRLHAGSLDAEKIGNWIKLLRHIYEYAIESYDSKEVSKVFNMQTSTKKIKAVWDLLGLPKELRSYYNRRILKVLLPKLAKQQKKAKQASKVTNKLIKLDKQISKMDEDRRLLMEQQRHILGNWGENY